MYATCTLNKNYLQAYEPAVLSTPNLEKFARSSLTFDRHQTEAGQSGIAFASMFSGLHADRHGIYRHPTKLHHSVGLISESFREAGYETFFWNGQPMASTRLGYGQGVAQDHIFTRPLSAEDPPFQSLLTTLTSDDDARAFVMTNFTVTHGPYDGTRVAAYLEKYPTDGLGISRDDLERFGKLYIDNRYQLQWNFPETVKRLTLSDEEIDMLVRVVGLRYKASVHHLDRMFGDLIATLERADLLDDSIVVFTSDHGEVLYRDNALFEWTHGFQLAPEVLNVPLIIHAPTAAVQPGRYTRVTRSIDVLPTILGLSGIGQTGFSDIEGIDLSSAVRGVEEPPRLFGFSHTSMVPNMILPNVPHWTLFHELHPRADVNLIWVSVRDGDMVYKYGKPGGKQWGFQVFDLSIDPMETTNRYDPKSEAHRLMSDRLIAYRERLVEQYGADPDADRTERRREDENALRSLGYLQ